MQDKISRRHVVRSGIVFGVLAPALGVLAQVAAAADLTPLDPNDPTAKALGFVNDSAKVDASANPTHKPNQKCGNCAQYQGKAGDARGGCCLVAVHTVQVGGWCRSCVQKPGA
jgi:hypothetical protein